MSEVVFLIDLASARPPHPPSTRLWPALAKEHCNQLRGCIHRIIAHSETKSVTTHVFDSTVLAQSGNSTTKPPEDALRYLDRRLEEVVKLDVSGVKHPAARGIVAGISDGAPEDSFSDFYAESAPIRDVYIFARAPSTKPALTAFLGDEEFQMSLLEQKLKSSPYLPNKLRKLAKRGDRVVWVNATPRRCELKDDVDHEAERMFSKWFRSYSSKFQFRNLHSFLLDRRVVPVKAMIRSLFDDFSSSHFGSGKDVEVLCLEDSHLLRCFPGSLNWFQAPVCEKENSKLSLVLSGVVRNYDTNELSTLGAFNNPAWLLTPSSATAVEDMKRPYPASIFSGLMVDLVRQNRCLVADLLEINEEKESFVRYQTLLEPVTPVTAVLRRISRITSAVDYSAPSLPETFAEWVEWDALRNIKDCETTDSVIQASPRFFETYLPTLFSSHGKGEKGDEKVPDAESIPKELASSRLEKMLMSFEDCVSLPTHTEQQALATFVEEMRVNPPDSEHKAPGNQHDLRGLIIEKLRSQLEAEQKNNPQKSPKLSSPDKPLSRQGSRRQGSLKSTQTFKWRSGSSKTIAPRPKELRRCIEAHMRDEKLEQSPRYTCANTRNGNIVETPELPNSLQNELATDSACPSAPQITTEVTEAHQIRCERLIPSTVLSQTQDDSSSPEKSAKEKESDAQSKESAGLDLGPAHRQVSECVGQKRKAEVLPIAEDTARKRDQLPQTKSTPKENDQETECEKRHRRDIRQSVAQFAVLMNKLREGDSRTLEGVLWKCIDQLSVLAAALSKNHHERCDIDLVINLNLKIPKAVAAAVQEVQNKAKRDDISPKMILLETWETIMYAFEQCVWHLASSRRAAINGESKTVLRRQVRQVSGILTCIQFMAEMAGNSRPQPVSFRSIFSKLFSSVFAHIGLIKSGRPFSEVLDLFEKFEEPLPMSLRAKNILKTREKVEVRKGEREHPKHAGIPSRSSQGQTQRGSVEQDDTFKKRRVHKKATTDSAAKERNYAKSGRVMKELHRRNKTFGLGRPQFAKESEALRNAMMRQTRLPITTLKQSVKQSSGTVERKRIDHMDHLGSSLQTILASTVPAPAIDDPVHASGSTLENTHRLARPPSKSTTTQQPELGLPCITADDTTVETSDSEEETIELQEVTTKKITDEKASCQDNGNPATSDIAGHEDFEKGVKHPTVNRDGQRNVEPKADFPDPAETQDPKRHAILKIADVGSNPSESLGHVNGPNLRTRASGQSENRRNGGDSASAPECASSTEFAHCERGQGRQKRPRKDTQEVVKQSVVPYSTRGVTRSNVKQIMSKPIGTDASLESPDKAQRRITRSQAKRTTQKRHAVPEERQNGDPGCSWNRKRRRTKELTTDPKVPSLGHVAPESKPSPKSSSPVTRSQAKAIEANGSIQLRNRSVSCPTRSLAVKPEVREVSPDSGTPLKNCFTPRSPRHDAFSSGHDILSPETPCPRKEGNTPAPQTPRAYNSRNEERSAIRRVAESSLERRRKELEHVEFIPETPVAPRPPRKYPLRDTVRRMLWPK